MKTNSQFQVLHSAAGGFSMLKNIVAFFAFENFRVKYSTSLQMGAWRIIGYAFFFIWVTLCFPSSCTFPERKKTNSKGFLVDNDCRGYQPVLLPFNLHQEPISNFNDSGPSPITNHRSPKTDGDAFSVSASQLGSLTLFVYCNLKGKKEKNSSLLQLVGAR